MLQERTKHELTASEQQAMGLGNDTVRNASELSPPGCRHIPKDDHLVAGASHISSLPVEQAVRLCRSMRSNMMVAVSLAVEAVVVVEEMHPLPVVRASVRLFVASLVLHACQTSRNVEGKLRRQTQVSRKTTNASIRLRRHVSGGMWQPSEATTASHACRQVCVPCSTLRSSSARQLPHA